MVLLPLMLLLFGATALSAADGMMHLAVSVRQFAVFVVFLRNPSMTMAISVPETS
jgi:hypothetical protein